MRKHTFRSLALVVLSACVTLVAVDQAFAGLAPVLHRREVHEGMSDLEKLNPEVLVLGSSHGRTFHVLGQELSELSHGSHNLVSIPLENGKLSSYAWLLDHRVVPLLQAPTAAAQAKRNSLKRFIIITEWWDSCRDKSAGWNLPSRAWTLSDYVASVAADGTNDFNRNFVQSEWRRLFWNSSLVQDRGFGTLLTKVMSRLRHRPNGLTPEVYQSQVTGWQKMVEDGVKCLGNSEEMGALKHLIDFGQSNKLETTIVLFPRKPDTLTEKARATTLREFHDRIVTLAEPMGVRVVDLTTSTPLKSSDFMDDFDHVNSTGNIDFAKWSLAGPLSFLLQPVADPNAGASR